MKWNLDDSRSIWPQLKDYITKGIITGVYGPGSSFPTVRDLAAEAGVNRNTMQRAMAELEAEGLLITNRTAGRMVTKDEVLIKMMRTEIAKEQVSAFVDEMCALGFTVEEISELVIQKGEDRELKGERKE